MPASIGVNLRVTGHCRQGGRKYMEDLFSVAYQQTEDEKDLEYAFFGIYDGHGGAEAAAFAKEHLMETIIKHKNFWSDYDEDVLRAIKDGYIATHYAMWKEQEKWPRTASGLPSTAGTTASVAFIRRGKIYIGHVGDSGIILGYQEPGSSDWKAKPLTRDHKPENIEEMSRIEQCGGKVVAKSGVPRVVWNRPRIGHQGPVRRSTHIDEIPFLAVARSLGDLWSYNSQINQFIVSPDPDCLVLKIDTDVHRCLVFGTDGLYNMLSPMMAVHIVQQAERHNENAALSDATYKTWLNPSKLLVERALERWHATKMRADNTSVVTLMLDPPGPPRAQVLKDRKKNLPERGLRIMTRFDPANLQEQNCENNNCNNVTRPEGEPSPPLQTVLSEPEPQIAAPQPQPEQSTSNCESLPEISSDDQPETVAVSTSDLNQNLPLKERNFLQKPRESTSFDPRNDLNTPNASFTTEDDGKENHKTPQKEMDSIQCNEVSSSGVEVDTTYEEEISSEKNRCQSLRSAKKKVEAPKTNLKQLKRKLEDGKSCLQPRKSLRIDGIQKKASDNKEKERSSEKFGQEGKPSKEIKEECKNVKTSRKTVQKKLGFAQKIMMNKKLTLKKKQSVEKKKISKKKILMVLDSMRRVQKKTSLSSNLIKTKENAIDKSSKKSEAKKLKKATKVVVSRASFRRQSIRNTSQRQTSLKIDQSKVTSEILKEKAKAKEEKNTKNGAILEKMSQKSNSSLSSSNVSTAEKSTGRSLRSTSSIAELSKADSSTPKKQNFDKTMPKTKTIRTKIQQKTWTLRRSVMRKK